MLPLWREHLVCKDGLRKESRDQTSPSQPLVELSVRMELTINPVVQPYVFEEIVVTFYRPPLRNDV
jgi:hypothetical protein